MRIIHCNTNNESADHHLRNFHQCNKPRWEPLWNHTNDQKEKKIHDSVNSVIHGHEIQTIGRFINIHIPAKQQKSHTMIPMQENKRFLTYDKNGVNKVLESLKEWKAVWRNKMHHQKNVDKLSDTQYAQSLVLEECATFAEHSTPTQKIQQEIDSMPPIGYLSQTVCDSS